MISTCPGIVISSIPYSESSLICKIYTQPFGLNSFLLKGAKTGSGRKKAGLLRPLQLIEITHYRSTKSGLHLVKDISTGFPLTDISTNVEKTCISLFVAEILGKTLSENVVDPQLFEFISDSVRFLELTKSGYVSFHLKFLLQYFQFCGFFPSLQELLNNMIPDPGNPNRLMTELIKNPLYDNNFFGDNNERKAALILLLQFLRSQMGGTLEIKSLPVLEAVFNH